MATYAIGDIQGCYDSLRALLKKIKYRQGKDTLWLCGDMVNRGPKSLDVLRFAMDQGDSVVAVLGNHDMHLLSAAAGARKIKKRDAFVPILDAPDAKDILDWVRTRPFVVKDKGHVMVHAGLHPKWSIKQALEISKECEKALRNGSWVEAWLRSRPEPPRWNKKLEGKKRLAAAFSILVGIRTVRDDGSLCTEFVGDLWERPKGTEAWFKGRKDDETIVFGHWASLGYYKGKNVHCLDSGCVWGGELSALRLEDKKLFQQDGID